MENYRAVLLTGRGGLDMLQRVELPSRAPARNQARLRVLATAAGGTDVTMRRGRYVFAPPYPFVPGYEVIGEIDALGSAVQHLRVGQRVAALVVHGGYAEQILVCGDELVPVPEGIDNAMAVAMILNYVTAYQMITRSARLQPGQSALVTGASGGVGSALLELLTLHGMPAYATASPRHHAYIRSLGATPLPIEPRTEPLDKALRALVPNGVDAAFDALGGRFVAQCVRATCRGGTIVAYGFASTIHGGRSHRIALARGLCALASAPLLARRPRFYGISALYRTNKRPFLQDLAQLFQWLQAGKLHPHIHARLPLLAAGEAAAMLERGGVQGKIVHLAPH
jgi:NADPH:quinone reductase